MSIYDKNLSMTEVLTAAAGIVFLFFIIGSFVAVLFMMLWNLVFVYLFGVPILGFWQALALVIFLSWLGKLFRGGKE